MKIPNPPQSVGAAFGTVNWQSYFMTWWNYFFAGANANGGPGFVTTVNNQLSALAPLESAWTAYSVSVTATSGAFNSVSASGRYMVVGKTCFVSVSVAINNNGTAAGGVVINMPKTVFATNRSVVYGRANSISGKMLQGAISGFNATVVNYDNSYPAATGETLIINAVFETS